MTGFALLFALGLWEAMLWIALGFGGGILITDTVLWLRRKIRRRRQSSCPTAPFVVSLVREAELKGVKLIHVTEPQYDKLREWLDYNQSITVLDHDFVGIKIGQVTVRCIGSNGRGEL